MGKPVFLYGEHNNYANVTATDTAAGLDPNSILYASEDTFWSPADVSGTKELIIDRIDEGFFDGVGILGKDMNGAHVSISVCDTIGGTYREVYSDIEIIDSFNAWWCEIFDSAPPTERFVKLTLTQLASTFAISFVLFTIVKELPQFKESSNLGLIPEGSVQIGGNGAYISSNHLYTLRELAINWPPLSTNVITDSSIDNIFEWANYCVKYYKPFFFIPDREDSICYFAWLEKPKFDPVLQNKDLATYTISSMTARTRVA